jgi:uncharacterized iron-regulated protein
MAATGLRKFIPQLYLKREPFSMNLLQRGKGFRGLGHPGRRTPGSVILADMTNPQSLVGKREHVPRHNRRRALLGGGLSALVLSGCGLKAEPRGEVLMPPGPPERGPEASTDSGESLPALVLGARYVLLGEVHDNPQVHRLRLAWLRQLHARQAFVIAMEQFDLPMQPQLDAARQRVSNSGARELAKAGGFSFEGWDWPLYEPVLEFALQHGLPLVAANLGRREAMALARSESGADPRPSSWRPVDEAQLRQSILEGHCGLLPEAAIPGLVRAQLARDRAMASAMTAARSKYGLPVVLLAGNGHARRDLGVPRHLVELEPEASIASIGIVEHGDAPVGQFDRVATVEPFARPDPCAALRERFGERPGPAT